MTRAAAIDLSSDRARFVVVETTLRRSELIAAETLTRTADEDEPAFWQRVAAELPAGVDSLMVTAESMAASPHLVTFPFGDVRKVEQTLSFELENEIPYDVNDVIIGWHVTERSRTQTKVLTMITPKARLGERLQRLSDAGLEPRAIVPAPAALAELVSSKAAEPVAVLSVGAAESHLAVVDGTGLKFCRSIRAGGDTVDRALARALGCELAEARRLKETQVRLLAPDESATPDEARAAEAAAEGLKPLVSQLAATLKALPAGLVPGRLILTGGLSRLPGLAYHLSRRIGLEAQLLDLPASLGTLAADKRLGAEYAVAAGLLLALLRRGRSVPLNLRRGPFAYSGDMQLYRGEITRAAVGVAAILVLAVGGAVVRYAMVSSVERDLDRGFCDATKKIVGAEICDPTAAIATLKQTPGAGTGVAFPDYSAANLYEMLSRAIAADLDVQFSQLEFRLDPGAGEADKISGKGEAASFEGTEQIVTALKKDKCVEEAEVSKQKKGKNDRVEFSLTVKVKCPPGLTPGQDLAPVAAVAPGAAPAIPTGMTAEAPPASPPMPEPLGENDSVRRVQPLPMPLPDGAATIDGGALRTLRPPIDTKGMIRQRFEGDSEGEEAPSDPRARFGRGVYDPRNPGQPGARPQLPRPKSVVPRIPARPKGAEQEEM